MSISIEGVEALADWAWAAHLDPSDVRLLGHSDLSTGERSIIMVDKADFLPDEQRLSFEMRRAHVLNVGTTPYTVVVLNRADEPAPREQAEVAVDARPEPGTELDGARGRGDRHFLENLPPSLQPIGERLLREVRRHLPGELSLPTQKGKYVEKPDNFWTVMIQRRDGSLRITVRGLPEEFGLHGVIKIVPDWGSYSAFKVSRLDQVDAAVKVIVRAAGHKRYRGRAS